MTPRRELQVAVGLCLLGSLLVLIGLAGTWLTYRTGGDAVRLTSHAESGGAASSLTRALGLVGLAGVLALAATRSWGRVVVGALLLLAGVGVVASVVMFFDADVNGLVASACDRLPAGCLAANGAPDGPTLGDRHALAALPSFAGGVLMALGGALVAVRGRRWAGLSSSYEVPAARPVEPVTDKATWDALDRGDDPTA